MDAGILDQRIVIEKPSLMVNEMGEEVPGWVADSEVWARAMETPGREYLKGDFIAGKKVAFQIRFRVIDSTFRIIWNQARYKIDSVTGTRRSGETWLHCSEAA